MGGLDLNAAGRLPSRADALKVEAEAHFEAAEADFRKALNCGLVGDLRYALHMNRGVLRFQRLRLDEAVADFERRRRSTRPAIMLSPRWPRSSASRAGATRRSGGSTGPLPSSPTWRPCTATGTLHPPRRRRPPRWPRPRRGCRDLDAAIRREPPNGRDAAGDHARRARSLRGLGRIRRGPGCRRRRRGDRPRPGRAAPRAGGGAAGAEAVRRGNRLVRRGAGAGAVVGRVVRAARPGAGRAYRLRWGDRRLHAGLGLAPDWAQVHAHRGWAYLFANAPELAFQDFDAVVRFAPADPDGYGGRARRGSACASTAPPHPMSRSRYAAASRHRAGSTTPRGPTPRPSRSPPPRSCAAATRRRATPWPTRPVPRRCSAGPWSGRPPTGARPSARDRRAGRRPGGATQAPRFAPLARMAAAPSR